MTNATEMVFGTIDSDKSVAVELKHDDKLPDDSNTYIQVNDYSFFSIDLSISSFFFQIGCFTLYKYIWSTSLTNINISINCNFILYTILFLL
jgi:hypothetical protein